MRYESDRCVGSQQTKYLFFLKKTAIRPLMVLPVLAVVSSISLGFATDSTTEKEKTTDDANTRIAADATRPEIDLRAKKGDSRAPDAVSRERMPVSNLATVSRQTSRDRLRTVGWTDSRCSGCHQPDPRFSHPVGVEPSLEVPAPFPLVNGKIECITCHAGDDPADHAATRESKKPLLRTERTGLAFCALCHESGQTDRRNMHAYAMGTAHQVWKVDTGQKTFDSHPVRSDRFLMDNDERESCLSCHDGTVASNAVHTEYGTGGKVSGVIGIGHPVGVPYRVSNPGDSDVTLRPAASLDSRIRLFNGQVNCGSCHNLFSKEDNLLVMSNYRSALCLSCHRF